MRIGIDIRSLLDEPRSGVGEYTYNFLKKIINQDKDITFVLFFSGYKIPQSIINLQTELADYQNIEFYHLHIPNKIINFLWWLNLGPQVDKLLQVKNIWLPNFNFIKLSHSARLIITCHDVSFIYFKHLYSFKGRLWHKFVNPFKLYHRADLILAVSEQTGNDLEILNISKQKIITLYPIINFQHPVNVSWSDLQTQFNLPEKFFLYIGTLDPRKNIIGLLEGYKKYKQSESDPIQLVIGGRLGWNARKYYQQIFDLINNDRDIYYLGYVLEGYKSAFYSHATSFIFPSLYEGFGFPPVEAMNNNCPVIASHTGSLPEVVRGAAFLIDPYNITSIANSFQIMHHNATEKIELKNKNLTVVDYWEASQDASLKKLLIELKKIF